MLLPEEAQGYFESGSGNDLASYDLKTYIQIDCLLYLFHQMNGNLI